MGSIQTKIDESRRYIEELDWWLTFIRGTGEKPKAPKFSGWPDYRPSIEAVRTLLELDWDAGIGINLGGSRLIDVEADTDEGERFIDDLCRGHDFPCWQSRRGKHRLFRAGEADDFFKDDGLKIEFRTGRHQSVLPPSVIEGTAYQWIVDPFSVSVPMLPEGLRQFYEERRPKRSPQAHGQNRASEYQFRDHFDYVLRHFDLLKEAQAAGLRLVFLPDESGNAPCYVPANLRGRPDHHPSGLFSLKSGVLRDFADDRIYPFFRVMAALTGEPWDQIYRRYEGEAKAAKGRTHSRRISPPTEWVGDRIPLDEARSKLNLYFDEQLNRDPLPKTLHVIKGPPGLGKTFGLCGKLTEKKKRAIILTLENELADHHSTLLPHSRRMPVLRADGCIMPDEYEKTSRRGFRPSQGFPCRTCSIGPSRCNYLLSFGGLDSAEQLCCAAIYHTHADFYSSHGNDKRPIVVFDENCIDLLLEPVVTDLDDWHSWLAMAGKYEGEVIKPFRSLVAWLEQVQSEFLDTETKGDTPKFLPIEVPLDIKGAFASPDLEAWLNANAAKYPKVRNLYQEAVYLLHLADSHVLLERIEKPDGDVAQIRFRKKNPLPVDKEIFILDATANEELLLAIAPDWDVRVWECPAIEQAGRIVQIMDYDLSRSRIRGEVNGFEADNPTWLPQVLDHILEKHGPAALVSFKAVVDGRTDLLSLLRHREKIVRMDNFPCRGHSFEEKTLIVVGTPYKDEACVWEFAMAIWGKEGLPMSSFSRVDEINGDFKTSNRRHQEEHLRPIQDFILTADLVQAIGRVRPIQNDVQVFVLSNAPIHDWQVEQYMANELFDIKWHLRSDAADNQRRYFAAARELLQSKDWFGNKEVCGLIDMPERTGRQYWTEFKLSIKASIDKQPGRIRLKVPATLTF